MKYDRILDLVMSAMQDETTWRKTWQSQSGRIKTGSARNHTTAPTN